MGHAPQEARALRYIQARAPECARVVRLLGTFMHAGHMCLVLERLHPSLLDYLSGSATLAPCTRLANLRSIAYQLLVCFLSFSSCNSAPLPATSKPPSFLQSWAEGEQAHQARART